MGGGYHVMHYIGGGSSQVHTYSGSLLTESKANSHPIIVLQKVDKE
jgi:hypothetical protein